MAEGAEGIVGGMEDREGRAGGSVVALVAALAAATSVKDFTRTLRWESARRAADAGMSRLEQQQRATRLRDWVDAARGCGPSPAGSIR